MVLPHLKSSNQPGSFRWVRTLIYSSLVFLVSLASGILITTLLILSIPLQVPHPTEAYEGIGDAMLITIVFNFGLILSFLFAFAAGLGTILFGILVLDRLTYTSNASVIESTPRNGL